MKIELLRGDQQTTTLWSGGKTTQLSIYPKDAVYAENTFLWRLSTSSVTDEHSVFTKLPGVNRLLMIIQGKMHLVHQSHHSIFLDEYDQDFFRGDWDTSSIGQAIDYNLMLREDCTGTIEKIVIRDTMNFCFPWSAKAATGSYIQFYCVSGELDFTINNRDLRLISHDFLEVHHEEDLRLIVKNKGNGDAILIKSEIEF